MRRAISIAVVMLAAAVLAATALYVWQGFTEDDEPSDAAPTSSTAEEVAATTTTLALVDQFDVPTIGHVECRGTQVYVVAQGDALLGIIDNDALVQLGEGLQDGPGFITIVRRVAAANRVAQVDQIQAGQELRLPVRCDITQPSLAPGQATSTTLPAEFLFSFALDNGTGYCRGPVGQAIVGEQTNFFFVVDREVGFSPPLDQAGNPERVVAAIALQLNGVQDWGDIAAGTQVRLPQACGALR
jgi:hypothetical protein